ncbi:MAG: hypothetical protein MK142_05715 [Pseudomonadales bacterium]|nr:hypothetical protein [Pseudomonadales bacterium]
MYVSAYRIKQLAGMAQVADELRAHADPFGATEVSGRIIEEQDCLRRDAYCLNNVCIDCRIRLAEPEFV